MTAEPDLLPLPRTLRHPSDAGLAEHVQAYARANVAHATAAKDAEIEALRAEVERVTCELMDATTRADKLEEALRDAATSMQTIADKAGRDEYLMTIYEVRCYANSRANAARGALSMRED